MDGPITNRGEARLFAGIELGGTKCICTLAAGPDDIRDQRTIATTVPTTIVTTATPHRRGMRSHSSGGSTT